MIQFELFIQTGYSLNGSLIDIHRLVKKAKEVGLKSLGIADFNNMYGALKFTEACLNEGIKPILGLNTNLLLQSEQMIPILLYAENNIGYHNLLEISSYVQQENGRIPLEHLVSLSEGVWLVLLSTSGLIYAHMMEGRVEEVSDLYHQLKKKVKRTYLGIDTTDINVEFKIAPELKNIGDTFLVHQVSLLSKDDLEASLILKKILKDEHPSKDGFFETDEIPYYLRSSDELTKQYQAYPEAIKNAEELISLQDVTIELGKIHLPTYPTKNGYEAEEYLRALAFKGLERRLQSKKKCKVSKASYIERLEYELNIIHEMKYDDYFLIVWDFVLYAKKKKILVGPGRGSAAGSLVSYCLGIVDIDPLDFDLYFERFLNPERITMPDIDMDFPDNRREEVIEYVVDKYGKDHVTSIITFGTFQGKSAIRDTARILGLNESVISEVTSYIAETDNSIDSFEQSNPQKYQNLMNNLEMKRLFDIAKKLVGLPRHTSTHAAGIIITKDPITSYTAIQPGLLNMYQTQFEASDLEKLGLLKIDFLGLRNLTTIQNVLDSIEAQTGESIDIYKIDLEDSKTYKLLQDVSSLGVFQLESQGMMSLMRRMQIKTFEDISTCIALFRPGPMESIPSFIARREGKESVTYLAKELEPILSSTEGIIIYQEQIMKIANEYAGYSLGEADVLRRAVSKKKESVLLSERQKFISKCNELGRDEQIANQIYDYIVKFANYGFNKSHSVVYSLVAYWMAYLKANYPTYFMATLLDASIGSQTATSDYIKECRKLGIKILPPTINQSKKYYGREGANLRYPLLGIKNIGGIVADRLVDSFKDTPYQDFIDFMKRTKDVNSRVVESLILVGMFDEFGLTKQTLIENMKQIIAYVNLPTLENQASFVYIPYPEYEYGALQKAEKDLIGFNLRYHPLNQFSDRIEKEKLISVTDILMKSNEFVNFVAYIDKVRLIKTKHGETMAFIVLEDAYSSIEAVVFPKDYEKFSEKVVAYQIAEIVGKLEERNNQLQVLVKSIKLWEEKV
ncbi:MAG: DNA polymerase III subunit alpha [Candidatus Izemoplasmatales bacterium]